MKFSDLNLCPDLVVESGAIEGRQCITTAFMYPGGDNISVYVVSDGDRLILSDLGDAVFRLDLLGYELSDSGRAFVAAVCAADDIKFDDGVLSMVTSPKVAAKDFIRFCEAIIRVSAMECRAIQEEARCPTT